MNNFNTEKLSQEILKISKEKGIDRNEAIKAIQLLSGIDKEALKNICQGIDKNSLSQLEDLITSMK